uniref:Bax inhibitor 1 n=1 Tax=Echinococcus granulosus TaxID=6210 RepID=A0A068WJQ5_ECHGR|nr:Bax inhibitor 1 [Echinococcus granulosus]
MSRTGTSRYFDPNVLFTFRDIEKPVQIHLKNVYSLLSVGLIAASIGSFVFTTSSLIQHWAFSVLILSAIASIVSCCYIMFTQHTESQLWSRMTAFLVFTLSTGIGLGPLVNFALQVNPSSLSAALLGTAIIFVAFTFASLLTRKRLFVYLGGVLGTAIGVISTFGLMNLFLRSPALFQVELYLSFLIFCGFVVYDTQLIVFKRQLGDVDFIRHALDLFVDVIELFRHLLIILNSRRVVVSILKGLFEVTNIAVTSSWILFHNKPTVNRQYYFILSLTTISVSKTCRLFSK